MILSTKVNSSTPRPEGQGLPSTRAQAEGLRVDPEPRFLTPVFKDGAWRSRTGQSALAFSSIFLASIVEITFRISSLLGRSGMVNAFLRNRSALE